MTRKRLFIIDAMAMAFRNFYAFGVKPLTTSAGTPVSAVFGSAIFMNKLISEENPDFLVVATDTKEPTFRHELYSEYKANRKEMPEELAAQLPYFFELFDAMSCPLFKQGGVEADDLIGSLVKKFAAQDIDIFIVSGDKDFMQLVDDHTFLYTPKKGGKAQIIGKEGVLEKFSCAPEQVIDALAIIGDSADNVPGIHGIGEKGAAKLISTYGSLDGIYEHLDEIKNKRQRTGLEEHKEMAYLSQTLVTIKTDIPLDVTLEQMARDPNALSNQKLLDLYTELEFRGLSASVADRMGVKKQEAKAEQAPAPENITSSESAYQLVNTKAGLEKLVNTLQSSDHFCFDTETTGLDIINDKPIGISFSVKAEEAFYIPLTKRQLDDLTADEVLSGLKPLFSNDTVKIGHNLKFDIQMMKNVGVDVTGPLVDTMICSWLVEANARGHGLDACCLRYLNYEKIKTETLIGKKGELPMLDADLDQLVQYACEDADYTLRLYEFFMPIVKEKELEPLLNDIEMPLVPILANMEQNGVYVDASVLSTISKNLTAREKELVKLIYAEAGEEFNINSPKQLQQIMFEKMKIHELLGIKRLKKTKTGFSTNVTVLEMLSEHPLPEAILKYRSVTKLKNTYVDALPKIINSKTGRLHTSFHQTGTVTGRLSSSNPNLQNIPIRTPDGKEIRKAFKPQDSGNVIIAADYSQVELRLLAEIADEKSLTKAFIDGVDIHRATAAKVFGVAPDDVDSTLRSRAKAINFGIIYGMGANRLARETGVTTKEAKSFIEKYFESYDGIKTYIDKAIEDAKTLGYSQTITGRRRPIPGFQAKEKMAQVAAENVAVNSPIQGSAADLIKIAMIKVQDELNKSGSKAKMLLQVHDELIFTCPRSEYEKTAALIKETMENAMELKVPVVVDVGMGDNWLEAH